MKKLLKNKIKGFTLIELMIVVAIIGILAAIAIPNFIRYQLKSKTTEAKTVLGGVKTSQESFRAEIDNYANVSTIQPSSLPGTVKADWGSSPTAYTCPTACDREAPGSCNSFDCIGYSPSGQVYYRYVSPHRQADTTLTAEFAAGAQADLDGDLGSMGEPGEFAYRSSNDVTTTNGLFGDGLTNCASDIAGGFIQDCRPGRY
jgi:type IV pilus assembly protein PilA